MAFSIKLSWKFVRKKTYYTYIHYIKDVGNCSRFVMSEIRFLRLYGQKQLRIIGLFIRVFKIFTKHNKFITNNNLTVHSCGSQPFSVGMSLIRLQQFCEPSYINSCISNYLIEKTHNYKKPIIILNHFFTFTTVRIQRYGKK
jgi:hypothetical protein